MNFHRMGILSVAVLLTVAGGARESGASVPCPLSGGVVLATPPAVYSLQCELDEEAEVDGITSVDLKVAEYPHGRYQVTGTYVNAGNVIRSLNTRANGTFDDQVALVLASGGEIVLSTESDEDGEEYMIGRMTLNSDSDEEGLVCFIEELEN